MTPESQHTIETLAELVADGKCVLFLGNDLPLGYPVSAPPCRQELAAELACALGLFESSDLATITMRYEGRADRNALNRRVIELLDNPAYRPTPLHTQIAALPFKAIVTTAQNRLLEQALQMKGKSYATVLTDVETPYVEEGRVMIYKLHGCVSRPASLVLTQKDHCLLNRRLDTYLSVLRYLFVTRPLLFLNYSLADSLFGMLFHEVTADVEGHRRRAYAVWPGAAPEWAEIWARDSLALFDRSTGEFLDDLARRVSRHERALTTKTVYGPLAKSPYKFLDYYETEDRDIFYGRQIESVRFFRLVLSHRLTVLFGASGTGKTSLIKAGVMPLLHEHGYATSYVRALDDPLRAVRDEVLALLHKRGRSIADPGAPTLRAFFHAVLDPDDRLVVFIDQFEEFFLRLGESLRHRFWVELADFRGFSSLSMGGHHSEPAEGMKAGPEVRFVFSLREDFLAPLDEARQHIPELLGDSYRLVNLSDDKASTVVTEPAARAGLELEPALVTALLDDLREVGVIAPPQLQIVCHRLYRDCLANPDAVEKGAAPVLARERLMLDDYHRLGGARGILAGYVNQDALRRLPDDTTRMTARSLLKAMVTSRETKSALDWSALLSELAQVGEFDLTQPLARETVRDTLARLVNLRLVREFERGGTTLYELAHDHLATEIATWLDEEEMHAKLARELLCREMESWRSLGKLIEPAALALIHEHRDDLKQLDTDELELLFRSALAAGVGAGYWCERARAGGMAVDAIALEGLRVADFRARAAAVTTLGQLGERYLRPIVAMLGDAYPQVRVAAIRALERLWPDGGWHKYLKYECYVPAGVFVMGEGDMAHKVYVDAFYIGKYPVTNADYRRYMEDKGHPFKVPQGKEDHPVVEVSWYSARDYAAWAGMRLLTEAEWEKAASWEVKADGRLPQKRVYPWGHIFDMLKCNVSNTRGTTPVKMCSPDGDGPYGCADMAGNVWEWTSSLYESYPYQHTDGREDPQTRGGRVRRGGSWIDDARFACCTFRNGSAPSSADEFSGFRCGLSVSTLPVPNHSTVEVDEA
jgi:hypothetical protein